MMLLRCRESEGDEFGRCPEGVRRLEDGQASLVIKDPGGVNFTINFMNDGVTATNRETSALMEGDAWIVEIDGNQIYQVPLAAIEGG